MSKFCEHCGSELKDNDKVCPNCGAAVEGTAAKKDVKKATTNTANTDAVEKSNIKTIAIIGGIIVAAIIVIVVIFSLIGGAYKKPIKNYYAGIQKASSKTYLKAYPDFMKEDLEDKYDDDYMEDKLDRYEDEYGEKLKISYKFVDKIKMTKDELKDVKEYYEKLYDDEKIKITAGYKVVMKTTYKGKDEKETTFERFNVLKINGKWCVMEF